MKTSDFRTKTLFIPTNNGVQIAKDGSVIYPVSIDVGYSGVKLYGPNICCCFPSYARRVDGIQLINELSTDSIVYREGNETWLVGRVAQDFVQTSDTTDSIEALCGRNRYFSDMFRVICNTALGIAMSETKDCANPIPFGASPFVQTGLPCQYIKSDTPYIKEAMSGHKEFSVQIGQTQQMNFCMDIPEANVLVMRQPMGAFISTATDANWKQDISKYANSSVLIFDPGFKTLDTFSIRNGALDSTESWPDLGMSRVLIETANEIFKQYGTEIPVANMQKYLEEGTFTRLNRREKRADKIGFASILEAKSKEICKLAIDKAFDMYNGFMDYRYLILAGGTGEAWAPYIRDELKNINNIAVINGNTPDNLPMIFVNVRGYHSYLKAYLAITY